MIRFKEIDIPSDIDAYLRESEERRPDIVPGTEKKIIWNTPGKKTPVSLVFLHGFSGSRQDMFPVMEWVAAGLGMNLFLTRYEGHGRGPEALAEPDVQQWADDTAEAIAIGKMLGNKLVVVGLSTGAPLAAWACTNTDAISALILVSPNFGLANRVTEWLPYPWGKLIAKLFVGKYYCSKPKSERQLKYATPRYLSYALITMMKAVRLGRKSPLEKITLPLLCLYSENDDVISLNDMRRAFVRFGSPDKTLLAVEGAFDHVVAGDTYSPETTDAVVRILTDWIRKRTV